MNFRLLSSFFPHKNNTRCLGQNTSTLSNKLKVTDCSSLFPLSRFLQLELYRSTHRHTHNHSLARIPVHTNTNKESLARALNQTNPQKLKELYFCHAMPFPSTLRYAQVQILLAYCVCVTQSDIGTSTTKPKNFSARNDHHIPRCSFMPSFFLSFIEYCVCCRLNACLQLVDINLVHSEYMLLH